MISVAELRQDAVPYSQQVNMEYYTDEALVLRSKLREDPQVLAALDKWWQTLPKSPFGGVVRAQQDQGHDVVAGTGAGVGVGAVVHTGRLRW